MAKQPALRVVEPCRERVFDDGAAPLAGVVARVRVAHCACCRKDVHDLSRLTPEAAFGYAALHGDHLCARLPPPTPLPPVRAPILAGLGLALGGACASTPDVIAVVPVAASAVAPPISRTSADDRPSPAPVVDSDGDGVGDEVDRCPTDAAVGEADGCRKIVVVKTMGVVVNVPQVRFERNATKLTKDSAAVLVEIAKVMIENEQIALVRVAGHASLDERDPTLVSERRAQAVVDHLVTLGVARARLEVKAEGTAKPLAPNDTRKGREHNRRVGFEIASQ